MTGADRGDLEHAWELEPLSGILRLEVVEGFHCQSVGFHPHLSAARVATIQAALPKG
jgi:hypothetical protein